jgi:hypothetical protein
VFCITIGETIIFGEVIPKRNSRNNPLKPVLLLLICSATNLVLLVPHWQSVNFNSGIQFSLDHGVVCWTHPYILIIPPYFNPHCVYSLSATVNVLIIVIIIFTTTEVTTFYALNVYDTTSEFRTVAMSVIVDKQYFMSYL